MTRAERKSRALTTTGTRYALRCKGDACQGWRAIYSLLAVGLLAFSAPLAAQTEADVVLRTTSALAELLSESGVNLQSVKVFTGAKDKSLRVESGVQGLTIYSEGYVGSRSVSFEAGEVSTPTVFGVTTGDFVTERNRLTAAVSGTPQTSASAYSANGGSASVSATNSVNQFSVSTHVVD